MLGSDQIGLQRGSDVAVLGQDELGHIALGPGPAPMTARWARRRLSTLRAWSVVRMRADPRRRAGDAVAVAAQQVEEVHAGEDAAAAADGDALVAQRRAGHRPPVVGRTHHVVVGHEDVVEEHLVEVGVAGDLAQGRTSTPSACMSITMVVMPACLGASGLVRTVANPRWLFVGAGGPHLLAVDHPAAVDPGAPGLDRGGIGAGVGLTEELAPDVLPHQRLLDPAVHLVRGGVLVHRHDVPARDAQRPGS